MRNQLVELRGRCKGLHVELPALCFTRRERTNWWSDASLAYDCLMKIDNRDDALKAAGSLLNRDSDEIANALLEAYLEGIEQARSQFYQGLSYSADRERPGGSQQIHQLSNFTVKQTVASC